MAINNYSEVVSGTVEHITYQNEVNNYCVFSISVLGEELTCVGIIPQLEIGSTVKLYGEYLVHQKYGRQFKFENFENILPETEADILKYLSSGSIKGVGPATARQMVEVFHEKTLEIIENDYKRLVSIRGISLSKAEKIHESFKKRSDLKEIMVLLNKFDFSINDSHKIINVLGVNAPQIIENNPYVLCDDEIGFGFERVVEIARSLNFPDDSVFRISAGVKYILNHNLYNGHTCLPKNKLINVAMNLLNCSEDVVLDALKALTIEVTIKEVNFNNCNYIFLKKYYTAESYIASKLKTMLNINSRELVFDIQEKLVKLQQKFNIKYEEKQIEAIETALKHNAFVLTGGPGTGKTTTLKAIIEILEDANVNIALAAPTGRAAKRMSEVTGRDAKTIHRLLEVEWSKDNKQIFTRNEHNPLNFDIIIIDEMSMVDSLLFEGLLRATPLGSRIIMVGDSDQLPSVGAGNILNDILISGVVPTITLTEIFRQAMTSLIVTNAHKIIKGENPELDTKDNDMFMIDIENPSKALDYIVSLCRDRLPKAYGYDCFTNIQILCPTKVGTVGSSILNSAIQASLNPESEDKPQITFKGYCLRVGDKVMQIKNNYDIGWTQSDGEIGAGVFNGDIGTVIDINTISGKITVDFDEKIVIYNLEDANQLELAYAVTVHKSQGSEYDCVIIPAITTPEKLCYRNLLYTAVTRAKKQLIFIGDRKIIHKMVQNNKKTLRYTGLERFLSE